MFIFNHPIGRRGKFTSLLRLVWWQLVSRLRTNVVVGFGQDSRLIASRGMAGATGNIYVGLHEFREMAFFLHACRSSDLFLDVGANVGSYSVLIGREVGSDILAAEPVPSTFSRLQSNLELNGLDINAALNIGVGSERAELRFSSELDTVNHVLTDSESGGIAVPVYPLDQIVDSDSWKLMKLDVEGYEMEVINGGVETLKGTLALMVELNGAGLSYGHTDESIREKLNSLGFIECDYEPFKRLLKRNRIDADNAIFALEEHFEELSQRLQEAPIFTVRGVRF